MNKKGFTLVELLGVLIIMAIIMVVVVTPIIGQIRNTSKKLDDASLKVLYASATSYLDEHKNSYPKDDGMVYYISIGQLIDSEELTIDYLSSYSEEVLSRNNVIKVIIADGGYKYSFADTAENLSTLSTAYTNVENESVYNYIGGTYFSGVASNNYVYYSGFMWRIMGINEDGSIKLTTDEPISTLNFGTNDEYDNNYIDEWLNDYFLSRLKYSDFLVEQKLCYLETANIGVSTDICGSLIESSFYHSKVSLLSLYEYNLSFLNAATYLNSNFAFSTLTYVTPDSTLIYSVQSNGTVITKSANSMHYIRPVISLMPESTITSGDGTKSNPYILFKSPATIVEADNRTLNSLNLADGEYVSLNTKTYRVVDNDKSDVKLSLNQLYQVTGVDYTSSFGTTSTFDTNDGLAKYLNSTLYFTDYEGLNGVVKTKFWYQGEATSTSIYYKNSSLAKIGVIYGVNVALPKIGELLTAPIYGMTTGEFWTISKSSGTGVYTISTSQSIAKTVSTVVNVRPVTVLDANALVSGGNGTIASPYIVKY